MQALLHDLMLDLFWAVVFTIMVFAMTQTCWMVLYSLYHIIQGRVVYTKEQELDDETIVYNFFIKDLRRSINNSTRQIHDQKPSDDTHTVVDSHQSYEAIGAQEAG